MLRIGMIGSENSHSKAVSKVINVDKRLPGAKVVAVWGETAAFAKETAEAGQIPTIVSKVEDMLDMVDGVMIDHRHGKYHIPAATPFVKAGIPVFVDKPLCCSLAEGKRFLAAAAAKRVPVTSFSSIPTQKGFVRFRDQVRAMAKVRAGASAGPADLKSKYGGIFFYGIHQVDAVIELFGMDVTHVELCRHGDSGVGVLYYKDGPVVTINFINRGSYQFNFLAYGQKDVMWCAPKRDRSPYVGSTRIWLDMMRTGKEPIEHRRMLAPVAVLEALEKSLKTGKKVKVGKF